MVGRPLLTPLGTAALLSFFKPCVCTLLGDPVPDSPEQEAAPWPLPSLAAPPPCPKPQCRHDFLRATAVWPRCRAAPLRLGPAPRAEAWSHRSQHLALVSQDVSSLLGGGHRPLCPP
jgi:hypothetical protein